MALRGLRPWSGAVAVCTTIGSILLATLLSPSFSWRANALSNLGVTSTAAGTATTALLFNGGLIAGGAVGLVFCAVVYGNTASRGQRAVAVLLSLTLVLMALVGVFPQGTAAHFPVAAGFYLMISVTLWVDAGVRFAGRQRRRALFSGGAGTANLLTWLAWGAAGAPWGLAVPEIIGAFVFGGWVLARSRELAA